MVVELPVWSLVAVCPTDDPVEVLALLVAGSSVVVVGSGVVVITSSAAIWQA